VAHESESYIERKVCEYSVSRSCVNFKFSSASRKGVPDRIFLYKGSVMFIEFKRNGKKPTKLQEYTHCIIRNQSIDVHVIDDVLMGKKCIDEFVNSVN
jgi:hypothetical protein